MLIQIVRALQEKIASIAAFNVKARRKRLTSIANVVMLAVEEEPPHSSPIMPYEPQIRAVLDSTEGMKLIVDFGTSKRRRHERDILKDD